MQEETQGIGPERVRRGLMRQIVASRCDGRALPPLRQTCDHTRDARMGVDNTQRTRMNYKCWKCGGESELVRETRVGSGWVRGVRVTINHICRQWYCYDCDGVFGKREQLTQKSCSG